MVTSYGETQLAHLEARARFKQARRRRLTLLVPASIVIVWALIDLIGVRHARLALEDVSFMRYVTDHVEVIAWTVVLVLIPLAASIKPQPVPAGAALAFFAGPVMTPVLFGGGWTWWQDCLLAMMVALILGGARARNAQRRGR